MTDTTVRASFAMNRAARDSIKAAAKRYDLAQGEIVDLIPLLLTAVAERSLAERRGKLSVIKTLIDQATASIGDIGSLAPHMKPLVEHVIDTMGGLYRAEENAIENGRVLGLDAKDYEKGGFEDIHDNYLPYPHLQANQEMKSPFIETIRDIAAEAGAKQVTDGAGGTMGFLDFPRPGTNPIFVRVGGSARMVSFELPTIDFRAAYDASEDLPDGDVDDQQ
jgi:hypothetical protein